MSPDQLLSELRAVLANERIAIRKLDSKTVIEAALAKTALLAEVTKATGEERQALLGALALVRDELKRNLLLLAHARDCVREALAAATPRTSGATLRLSIAL
jgi:hypothetical protein